MARNKAHDKKYCGAKKRQGSGTCKRPAGWGTDHVGSGRCKLHGGRSTGAKTPEGKEKVSQNAIKHGAYIERIINDFERETYDWLHEETIKKYELDRNNPMHMAILHRACMTYLKLIRLDEWEMEEKIEAINEVLENDPETGKEEKVLKPNIIYNEDGVAIGEEYVRKRRLQWAKTPNWEGHFQKYVAMLGMDRATEQKMQQEDQNMGKALDAFGWLWGKKSEE